jgi:hypothetical protein
MLFPEKLGRPMKMGRKKPGKALAGKNCGQAQAAVTDGLQHGLQRKNGQERNSRTDAALRRESGECLQSCPEQQDTVSCTDPQS